MDKKQLTDCLEFLHKAENLKNTLRSAHTSTGRRESSAEHTWRLCLMIILFEKELPGLDIAKLLRMAIIHDLAEAVYGDIPAIEQAGTDKGALEISAMHELLSTLPQEIQSNMYSLWEEYEHLKSPEAEFLKGLDKLETIFQHNQGANPEDFNYTFNLGYGKEYMKFHPLLEALREIADAGTKKNAGL